MDHFELMPKIIETGAVEVPTWRLMKYSDGKQIVARPGASWLKRHFGQTWYVVHRADYQKVLLAEAKRLGAVIHLNAEVTSVDVLTTSVLLASQKRIYADVIIGADEGLHSVTRSEILGNRSTPIETGDLAYRTIIPKACPDDLPSRTLKTPGDLKEMLSLFNGWDPRLGKLLEHVEDVTKWKILHMPELDTWHKGSVTLLGDACHPTLPYQAQGAAMAVEDGATLGTLLGEFCRFRQFQRPDKITIPDVLELYELARKKTTTLNVQGAIENRLLYHMEDGPECDERNKKLAAIDWESTDLTGFEWSWGNVSYLEKLMGCDPIEDAIAQFRRRVLSSRM
ncbi:salicylate hydroxylase [Talaromyces pinophilus]|uniref:Salicylate hydroxylase n=1 Tax=Talaromyces pinophilus TaxID=128442 RepID=A0A6V8HH82_TALPI|nr:salicylate hydroxylase [Talaromyces pinophilus]